MSIWHWCDFSLPQSGYCMEPFLHDYVVPHARMQERLARAMPNVLYRPYLPSVYRLYKLLISTLGKASPLHQHAPSLGCCTVAVQQPWLLSLMALQVPFCRVLLPARSRQETWRPRAHREDCPVPCGPCCSGQART